jgi:hypothetical protein
MNLLMTGMIPTMKFLMPRIEDAGDPFQPGFWFTMSMARIVGFALGDRLIKPHPNSERSEFDAC